MVASNGDYIDGNQSNLKINTNFISNLSKLDTYFKSDKGISCGEKSICFSNKNLFGIS